MAAYENMPHEKNGIPPEPNLFLSLGSISQRRELTFTAVCVFFFTSSIQYYGGLMLIGPNSVCKNSEIQRFLSASQVLLTMVPRNRPFQKCAMLCSNSRKAVLRSKYTRVFPCLGRPSDPSPHAVGMLPVGVVAEFQGYNTTSVARGWVFTALVQEAFFGLEHASKRSGSTCSQYSSSSVPNTIDCREQSYFFFLLRCLVGCTKYRGFGLGGMPFSVRVRRVSYNQKCTECTPLEDGESGAILIVCCCYHINSSP